LTTVITILSTNLVYPSSVTFDASTLSYSLNGTGKISGAGSLLKSGAGTLTINTANDYTGGTTITGGVLSVGANTALGANTGLLMINKTGTPQAMFRSTGTFTMANTRPLTVGIGGGAIEVGAGQTLTIAPLTTTAVTFNGPLAIQGGGALTIILAGAPIVGPDASMSIAENTTLYAGGTADPFSNDAMHMNVLNNGVLNIINGSKTVNTLSGTGNTTLAGSTQLTAASVVQNTLTISAGAKLTIAAIPGGPSGGQTFLSAAKSVPEPSTWAMIVLAAMGLGMYWRLR
jgi:fibronectin-binding autotransporter adhesin